MDTSSDAAMLDVAGTLSSLTAIVTGHRRHLIDGGFPEEEATAMAMGAYASLLALMTTPLPGGPIDTARY